jgi:hypothetical protein
VNPGVLVGLFEMFGHHSLPLRLSPCIDILLPLCGDTTRARETCWYKNGIDNELTLVI